MPLESWVPTALPFLPMGKGSLILIMGGLFVVTFSLLWALLSPLPSLPSLPADPAYAEPRPPLQSAARGLRSRRVPTFGSQPPRLEAASRDAAPAPQYKIPDWLGYLTRDSQARGFGPLQVTSGSQGWCVARFPRCSWAGSGRDRGGCASERAFLETAAKRQGTRATVVERACDESVGCTFEVFVGGPE